MTGTKRPLQLFYAPTPNGWKIAICLEELGIPYDIVPVALGKKPSPEFLAASPNGKIPAIVDHGGPKGETITIFESGAILCYLSEKTGRLMPADVLGRYATMQWLMWQMAGLGPMIGQNGHFLLYAPEEVPYARQRYGREVRRLYSVLDDQLERTGAFVAGQEYTVADIACFPWIMTHKKHGLSLAHYPATQRWFSALRARPAVQRGLAAGGGIDAMRSKALTPEERDRLYGLEKGANDGN